MSRDLLYAYVEGYDLDLVAPLLEARFKAFVSGRRWVVSDVWVVNQRHGPETSTRPGDLPPVGSRPKPSITKTRRRTSRMVCRR